MCATGRRQSHAAGGMCGGIWQKGHSKYPLIAGDGLGDTPNGVDGNGDQSGKTEGETV